MQKFFVHSIVILFVLVFVSSSWADTFVQGAVSGEWDLQGSPYYVIDNCTIDSGQELIIHPGVLVIIGEGLSITANGKITAVGTPGQRITFRSPNVTIYWEHIKVVNGSETKISRFEYCDISNAENAIYLEIGNFSNATMITKIINCNFSNILQNGIYGDSQGLTYCSAMGGCQKYGPYLNPTIENCQFDTTNNGVTFYIHGYYGGYYYPSSVGRAEPKIKNCIFTGLTGAAFNMTIGTMPGYSKPEFINNTVVDCYIGIFAQDPYDAFVRNNIFYGNDTAVERTGEQSSDVVSNCFFNNDTDFIGYPSSYGTPVMFNINGDPCDLGFNIFMNPLFISVDNYHLTQNSPCIDAGTADGAPDKDVDGDSRPQGLGYDNGADEYIFVTNLAEIIGTQSSGIWYWDLDTSNWTKMTSNTPDGDIAAGDFTGDGKADVASCWDSGLWYQNGDTLAWTKVGTAPNRVTAGDITGDGQAEIIGTWGSGIWYWDVASSKWTRMTSSTPTGDIAAGDFTGDGKADVASIWDSGLWYQNGDTLAWTKISGTATDSLTASDVTGDGRAEIIGTWSSGIWYWDVAAFKWSQMTSATPDGDIAAGDFTGDGRADVASCWDSGLWYQDGATLDWTKLSNTAPTQLTAGDLTWD